MSVLDFFYYAFITVVFTQVLFYLLFFRKFFLLKTFQQKEKDIPVSIVICAKNEAEHLKKFLPSIISQSYKTFEVVLVNDNSKDNTLEIMEGFSKKHTNIQIVNKEDFDTHLGGKKYALTLGIRAAKYDYLLFTDADCKPLSNNWICEMTAHFFDKKSIVLGYGAYSKIKNSLLNKLIRFETLITAIQYFSFAKIGLPYMGVGRNLAYKRKVFFNANGFTSHINIRSGDDDLFINQVANNYNTSVSISKDSFTESVPEKSYKSWIAQKRRHISTAKYYKGEHKFLLALIYSTNLLFWIFSTLLLITTHNWSSVFSLFLLRLLIQYIIIGGSSQKLNETDLLIWIPFLEIFLILIQLTIFISNLISKPNFWK